MSRPVGEVIGKGSELGRVIKIVYDFIVIIIIIMIVILHYLGI